VDWAGQDGKTIDETSPLEPRPAQRGHYTRAKLEAEMRVSRAAREAHLPAVILRPGQIFGGKMPLLTAAVARKIGGRWIVLGNGKLRLPLIHLDDVVEAVRQAADSPLVAGQIIQLVHDEQPTQNQVLRQSLGPRGRVWRIPRGLVFCLGGLSEIALGLLHRPSPLSRYRLHSALSRLQFHSAQQSLLPGWRCRVDTLASPATPAPSPRASAPALQTAG